jgi:predicted nucleic acid-binding protein
MTALTKKALECKVKLPFPDYASCATAAIARRWRLTPVTTDQHFASVPELATVAR